MQPPWKHKDTLVTLALRSVWDTGAESPGTKAKLRDLNSALQNHRLEIEVCAAEDMLLLFLKAKEDTSPENVIADFPYTYMPIQMSGYVEFTALNGEVFVLKHRYSVIPTPFIIPESVRNKPDQTPWVRPTPEAWRTYQEFVQKKAGTAI